MAQTSMQQAANRQARIAEMAIRTTTLMLDLQMQAARDILEIQARTARIFGFPDYSGLFSATDDRARRALSESADELVNTARRATETAVEVNRQVGRLVEQQTVGFVEQMRQGIGQLGRHTEQNLRQARDLVQHSVEEIERASDERSTEPGRKK